MEISDEMRQQERELRELLGIEPRECAGLYAELKDAAWNVLHENPGCEFGDWRQMLLEQYPSEVIDVFGSDPEEVYAQLAEFWDSEEYDDPDTGLNERFKDWAEIFANEWSVQLYDMLVEAKRK